MSSDPKFGFRCCRLTVLVGSESKIEWECNNGGVLYASGDNTATGNIPSGFCASGYSSLRAAFIVSLLIDLVFHLGVRDVYIVA